MTIVIIEPYPSKYFPWLAIAKGKRYSSVFETREAAKATMVALFGKYKFIERT